MDNNELLQKLANNQKILYLFPHLIYISLLLPSYYLNKDILFFRNIIFIFLIYFITTIILQIVLKLFLKNDQYIFYTMFFLCFSYSCRFEWLFIIQFFLSAIIIFTIIKKSKKINIDTCIGILIFFIGAFFFVTVPKNIYLLIDLETNTSRYKETYDITVSDETDTPNIYWIHCDGMMNFDTIKNYFHYDNMKMKNYLKDEDFYYNEKASLVADHKTQKALAALFNPNYYDNFLKEYLYDLEDVYLGNADNISYNVSTKELVDKRFNNELMSALKEKGYTTIGITKFNNYSSVKTDILYDYYNFTDDHWHFPKKQELRKMTSNEVKNIELNYNYMQLKEFFSYSIYSPIADNYIPFDHEVIDYNDLDVSNYPEINANKYWQAKAILKSIDDSNEIDNKFVFIDYDLNHTAFSFDATGNKLYKNNQYHLNSYVGNYMYSTNILIDIVNYIKDNDSDAIIILQADHGVHTIETDIIQNYFDISIKEVQEIRNSVMNAIYIPDKYRNGDEDYLNNPLNISRYLVNNFVGKNYQYIEE